MREHPITPVTEPLQYRAIGLVRGTYCPEDIARFTRGILIDEKGLEIESVVLGRLMTLMQRHISLEKPHLWVVYPRCRDEKKLHLQLAGVWEPSTLEIEEQREGSSQKSKSKPEDKLFEGDDYFSIRGELIFTKSDTQDLIIKIRQKPRKNLNKPLPFKIFLKGDIPINYLNHFLSINARRIGDTFFVENYESIALIRGKEKKNTIDTRK
tara:strand:- start:1406 stop:2035 length:630 start_codon:yes stop_codon:yes gene_type:complete